MMKHKLIRCFAEGSDSHGWEAICLELDIAVYGESFEQVFAELKDAIEVYCETLNEMPREDQERLINRCAPFKIRARYTLGYLASFMFGRGDRNRHDFTTIPNLCPN